MKKRTLLSVLLCCMLLLTMLAACSNGETPEEPAPPPVEEEPAPAPEPAPEPAPSGPQEIYTIDFADGNTDFIVVNTAARGADPETSIEVVSVDGGSALAITTPRGGEAYIGISLEGLLGAAVADVKTVVFEIYAEYPDGNFSAVGGEIKALNGDLASLASSNWTVYIDSRNPNQGILELGEEGFTAGDADIIEFAVLTNGPAGKGETPAVINIKSIMFFDGSNEGLPVDTGAVWTGPEAYGAEAETVGKWYLPLMTELDGSDWAIFMTPGTDGITEQYMPWEVVASSYGIVFEMADPGDGGYTFVHYGGYNGWGWTEVTDYSFYAGGALTIMWDDIGFDPSAITETDPALKFQFGNWNGAEVTAVYLLYGGPTIAGWELPLLDELDGSDWAIFMTPGTDGITDEYMPWEVVASSHGIVFEMEDPGDGGYTFVHYGGYNGWGWTEVTDYSFYAGGALTIMWEDIGFDPSAITADESAVKFQFGNWNGAEITAVYLLYTPAEAANWELPILAELDGSDWAIFMTPGTDGITDEYMPWETVAASYGIVFEMEDPGDGGYTFVHYGAYNGWGWTEVTDYSFYADGKLTIMWDDIGFDTSAIEADPALKFQFGNWNGVEITAVYLIME